MPQSGTIYSAQYLRFIAATLVVLVHIYEMLPGWGKGDFGTHFNLGASGVDIFFVLSGFIMCVITESRETTAKNFLLHRLLRVAPPYWAITILMTGLIIVAPSLFNSSRFELTHVISSFLFFAWPHPVMRDAMPVYFPGWTLNYEAFFYIIFASFLAFPLGKRVLSSIAVIISLIYLGLFLHPSSEILKFYTKPIMMEFIFGMGIGYIYMRSKTPRPEISYSLIVNSLIGLTMGALYWSVSRLSAERFLVWGALDAMLVLGFVSLEAHGHMFKNRFLKILGDASYATYLTHFFVVGGLEHVIKHIHPKPFFTDMIVIIPSLIICWIVGIGFHFWFEKPLINYLKIFFKKSIQ